MDEHVVKTGKIKKFIKETIRVLRVTKKPNRAEFSSIAKVTGLGCAAIGLIGFVLFMIKQLLF
jgi:protein transport protein SEC61 subunit gamma and related proteins